MREKVWLGRNWALAVAGVGMTWLSGCQLGFDPHGLSLAMQHAATAPQGAWEKPEPKPTEAKPVSKPEIVPGSAKKDSDSFPAKMARQGDPPVGGPSGGAPMPVGNPPHPVGGPPQPVGGHAAIGEPCASDREGHLCLALKYVVYRDSSGEPIESAQEVADALELVNRIWRRCGIAFQIDEASAIRSEDYGLRFRTANYPELNDIRQALSDDSTLLVAVTGTWNRRGSLGSTGANAWTNMPGDALYGAVLERPVEHNPNVIAHELGHYLSLDHRNDPSNVMNPVVGLDPMGLDRAQCQAARAAVGEFWQKMLR